MSQVVTNPQPKLRFQESDQNISKHRDLLQRNEFQRAVDFALLQYQAQLAMEPINGNFNAAAANHFKTLGALEFIHVLRMLGETPIPMSIVNKDNLDHNVK